MDSSDSPVTVWDFGDSALTLNTKEEVVRPTSDTVGAVLHLHLTIDKYSGPVSAALTAAGLVDHSALSSAAGQVAWVRPLPRGWCRAREVMVERATCAS